MKKTLIAFLLFAAWSRAHAPASGWQSSAPARTGATAGAAGGSITPIGGACSSGGGSGQTVSYTPTAGGNTMVIGAGTNGAAWGISAVTVTDNLSNSYSPAATEVASFPASYLYVKIGSLSGITSWTLSWSGGQGGIVCVEEYSGVVHVGSVPVTASGSGSTYTETLSSTTGTNNYFVSAVNAGGNATVTATGTTGNTRQNQSQTTAGGNALILQDNTTASSGASLTTAGTLSTSTNTASTGIELKSQ